MSAQSLDVSFVEAPLEVEQALWRVLFAAWVERKKPDFSGVVVVSFVDQGEMTDLYYRSFGKRQSTDVLSFKYTKSRPEEMGGSVGEIVICLDVARANAAKLHVHLSNELMTLFVHGLLHLLDLDHATDVERAHFEAETRAIMGVVKQEPAPLWLLS